MMVKLQLTPQSLNQNLKKLTQSLLKLSGLAKWNFQKGGLQEKR